ncbi:MAG: polyketide synthase dehydratase domain-containing protein, partial [Cyanobacteria bacterium P01_G01_bin.4]
MQTLVQSDGMMKIFAQTEGETDWRLHSTAWCDDMPDQIPSPIDLDERRSRCPQRVEPADLYTHLAEQGLTYGPAFQTLQELRVGEGEFLAQVELKTELADIDAYHFAPMLLDGAFQALTALSPNDNTDIYLPIGVETVQVHQSPGATAWVSGRGQLDGEDCIAELLFINQHGMVLAEVQGLRCRRATRQAIGKLLQSSSNLDDLLYALRWQQTSQDFVPLSTPGQWLVLGEESAAAELCQHLDAQHQTAQWGRSQSITELLSAVEQSAEPLTGLVLLCPVHGTADADAAIATVEPVLQVVQELLAQTTRLPQGLTLVTQRAIAIDAAEDMDPAQTAVWGLGRSLQIEQPQLGLRLIDVTQPDWERLSQLLSSETEPQLALRGTQIHIPRLLRQQASGQLSLPTTEDSVKLTISQRGSLDNLQLVADKYGPPAEGDVQVAVQAAGLNFRDVLNTLGAYPGDAGPLGGELAGVVTAIGEGVSELTVGDRVFGMGAGCFATTCNTPAALLVKMPENLDFTAAATVPITFCTAQAALEYLGLKRGEKILIHAAAGGVGLAAVQLAQLIGAEIYATASAPKQAYLRQLGIQ